MQLPFSIKWTWKTFGVQKSPLFSRKLKENGAVWDRRQGMGPGTRRAESWWLESVWLWKGHYSFPNSSFLIFKLEIEKLCQSTTVLLGVRIMVLSMQEVTGGMLMAAGLLRCCQRALSWAGHDLHIVFTLGKFLRLHVSSDLWCFYGCISSSIKKFL